MKITVFYLAMIALILVSFFPHAAEEPDYSLAHVDRIQGKYVFIYCEPVTEYEIVDNINTDVTSLISGQVSIDKQITEMVRRASKKEEKGKIGYFDALITEKGDDAILIKFIKE